MSGNDAAGWSFESADASPQSHSAPRRGLCGDLQTLQPGDLLQWISLELRQSEFTVAEYLHALCELKVLAVARVADASCDGDAVATIERLLAGAEQALQQGRGAAAREGLIAASDSRKRRRARS